jgi:hypothetical protein
MKRDALKLRRELDARLLPSEALEVVGAMLDLYPNGRANTAKGHIGGLAKVLCEYPMQVARLASHPVHGVARETKYIPVPADLIAWCDRESAPLQKRYQAAERAAEQIEQRDDAPTPAAIVSAARAWLRREDPKAQKLSGAGGDAERLKAEKALVSNREALKQRNAETVAEYEAAGLVPLSIGRIPISIELARMLGKEPTDYPDESACQLPRTA